MTPIYLSLGSNINPDSNLRAACILLEEQLGPLIISSVYISEDACYGSGAIFSNLAVIAHTALSFDLLLDTIIHPIERQLGRMPNEAKAAAKIIDIDVSYYGAQIIESVTEYFYRLAPLAEIAPNFVDPISGRALSEIFAQMIQQMLLN